MIKKSFHWSLTTIKSLWADSLYRNSIYLMLSTAVMAFFGFFFWIMNARLFSTEQVGIGTALISAISLISNFSLLGMNNSIIRYLPSSTKKNIKINTAFTLVFTVSLLMAIVYLLLMNKFLYKLSFIRENIFFSTLFVLFTILLSLNAISDTVFISLRRPIFILIKNILFSLVKLATPFLMISFGAFGIFSSVGIALVFSTILSVIFLVYKFNYILEPQINIAVLRRMFKFSLENYLADFIKGIPTMFLPIIILNNLGAKYSAYFYMDMMIANFLYIIPIATSQSLFAEGSLKEGVKLEFQVKRGLIIIFTILIPAIAVILVFGKYILAAFGKNYSIDGLIFLQLLSLSGIFQAINYVGNVILNIRKKTSQIIIINVINTTLTISLCYTLFHMRLTGVGLAWLFGSGTTALVYIFLIKKYL